MGVRRERENAILCPLSSPTFKFLLHFIVLCLVCACATLCAQRALVARIERPVLELEVQIVMTHHVDVFWIPRKSSQ